MTAASIPGRFNRHVEPVGAKGVEDEAAAGIARYLDTRVDAGDHGQLCAVDWAADALVTSFDHDAGETPGAG